jgi:hypothetical protein
MDINIEETTEFNEYVTNVLDILMNSPSQDFTLFAMFSDMFENDVMDRVLRQSEEEAALKEQYNIILNTKLISESSSECCICMDDIQKGNDVFKCECNKIFHHTCLNKWVKMKTNCPLCNRDISGHIINIFEEFESWIKDIVDF